MRLSIGDMLGHYEIVGERKHFSCCQTRST